jgi:D-alanyl-D-alanine carboxypeptidase (penicillin-binding protein 5/6)
MLALVQPLWAQTKPAFETLARNAILMDSKSGYVFLAKDAETAVPPASMSKLMTQAVVFDMLKSGELKLDQQFVVSTDASRRGGTAEGSSTMFATPNGKVTVENLLRGAIIESANDACIALAEGIAGTEPAFAQRMQAKATELGLKNSSFANATGLPDPGQRMSVKDLATLARYIIATHPEFYRIYGEKEFTWNKVTQQNRNPLLKDYPGADGMKTGYTQEAGYSLVGSAERNGRRLIVVIAGMEDAVKRKIEAQKLLDYGFAQFKSVNIYEAGETVANLRVWGGLQQQVNVVVPDAFRLSLAGYEQEKADIRITYKGPLLAPLKQGDKVGLVRVSVDGTTVAEQPITVANDVEATTNMWRKAADSAFLMIFGG